jgi:hypothetical protein
MCCASKGTVHSLQKQMGVSWYFCSVCLKCFYWSNLGDGKHPLARGIRLLKLCDDIKRVPKFGFLKIVNLRGTSSPELIALLPPVLKEADLRLANNNPLYPKLECKDFPLDRSYWVENPPVPVLCDNSVNTDESKARCLRNNILSIKPNSYSSIVALPRSASCSVCLEMNHFRK